MRAEGLKGALSPRLVAVPIAALLLAMALAFMGSSSGTHDATVSMVPVNSKSWENIEYTLTVANASGDNIDNVTLEVPLDEGGNALYRVATPVPAPENWTSELPENDDFGYAKKITWWTDNAWAHITAGTSENFVFTATTPLYDRTDNWPCNTSDISGYVDSDNVTTTVDNVPPGSPMLVWPDNDENINDNTPNLDWSPVSDPSIPVTYDLLVDDDTDFLSPEVDVTWITEDNYVTVELGENTWNWKVRARDNASNIGLWSSPRYFRVDITPPDSPTLVWPADGENISDNTPNLDWNPVIDSSMPVTYDLVSRWWNENWLKRRPITIQAGENGMPAGYQVVLDRLQHDADMLDNFDDIRFVWDNGESYELDHWVENYILAENALIWFEMPSDISLGANENTNNVYVYYSNPSAVSAENENAVFELFDNFNGSSLDTNKWTIVGGNYSVAGGVFTSSNRNTNIYSNDNFGDNVRWDIRINAVSRGNSDVSPSFTSDPIAVATRRAMWLIYHDGWDDAHLDEDGDGTWEWSINTVNWGTNTWYELDIILLNASGTYTRYERDGSVVGSTTYMPTAPLQIVFPYRTTNASAYSWTIKVDWTRVRTYIEPEPTASVGAEEIGPQTRITDDNYQITTELSEGICYWKVRAVDNVGNIGVWSPLQSFRVDITPPIAPTLLAPTDEIKTCDNTPTFGWTAVTDVSMPVTYELQVDDDAGFGSPEINVSHLPDNTYTPTTALADENYFWRVRARDNAGNAGPWSSAWTLLIDSTPHDATVALIPVNSKPGISIDYVLTVTDNATGDNIENVTLGVPLDEDGNAFYRVAAPIPAPAGWTSVVVAIDNFGYARKVRWLADNPWAHIAAGESENFTFTATTPLYDNVYTWTCLTRDIIGYVDNDSLATRVDNVPPPAPTLLEPENGAIVTDNTPTFRWIAVDDDSLPVTYTIQVDNENDFSSPEIDVSSLTDNAYTPPAELADDNYSWRVRATDNAGHVGPYSQTWTLMIKAVEWNLIETLTGTIEAPAVWQLIEIWTGTVQAPVEWRLIETWTGTVEVPPPWAGTATFSLTNLYTVNLKKILDLNQGSKLVVKFYDYSDAYENENVIETFSPPWHVEENENARHPEGIGVKKARLDLTYENTENVISTIATFTVTLDTLNGRIVDIYLEWPFASPERRNILMSEIVNIYLQWPYALLLD